VSGTVRQGVQSGTTDGGAQDVSDGAVEAEVVRLLGGVSEAGGTRTAQQAMDAISTAFGEKSDLRRFLAIYEAVSELGKGDIAEAVARARSENNPIALRALERRWAEVDPVGAMKEWADGKIQAPGDAFYSAWAQSNATSALQWYTALPDGEIKTQARAMLLDRVARVDPQRALDFANQMPEGKDQSQLVSRALLALGGKDSAEALAVAQRLPEGPGRRIGLDSVASQMAATSIEDAQRLMGELPPNTLTNAASAIGAGLVKESPQKAVDWALTLPEGSSKEAVFAGIAREWANKDVVAAATWLDTLPKGSVRDSAVASFANRTAPRDPEGATIWAATLPPGAQRASVLGQTVGIWQRVNPAAAADWIAKEPGLSAEERAVFAKGPPERPDAARFQQGRRQRAVGN